jgi:hypothetical protein
MSGSRSWLRKVRRDWREFRLGVNPDSMRCSWLNWPSTCRTAHRFTGMPRPCGRPNGSPSSYIVSLECAIIATMSGGCWDIWVGVASVRQAGHRNVRKRRSCDGNGWSGPALKKSQRRRAHPPLHRRERVEPEASPGTHMESQRPDPDFGVQLQLEKALGHRWAVLVEFLLSPLPRRNQDRAGDRFLETPPTARQGQAANRMGRRSHPPQPTSACIPEKFAWQNLGRTSPCLCPGTQPGRVPLELLETARVAQPVRPRSLATLRLGCPCAAPNPP